MNSVPRKSSAHAPLPPPVEPEKEMSFLDHLEELRWHILRSLASIFIVGIGLFLLKDWLFDKVIFGPTHGDFLTFRVFCGISEGLGLGDALCLTPPEFRKLAVGFGETFTIHLKVSFVGGFLVAFPYVFWEFWRFIKPGLHQTESKAARGVVLICSLLFLTGVLFGYYIISPFAVLFLAGYTLPGVENAPSISSFINYMIMFTLPMGLIFELPVVSYFLAKVGLVTAELLRDFRRHAIVAIAVVAAVITPQDVVTMLLVATPLYFLYEISILVAARVVKNQLKKQ